MVRRSWRWPLAVLAAGVLLGGSYAAAGLRTLGGGLVLLAAGYACWLSPLVFPRSVTAAEAAVRGAADGRPIIYWRPGCAYCLRLRRRLGQAAGRAHWVNIWHDPEAAATVRAITGGDETVPTVVLAGVPLVNPDPAVVAAALRPAG